jgi:choloylglycine hydrolase
MSQPRNPGPVTTEGGLVPSFGQGCGMRGLPAEGSAPARFMRAVGYVATLRPVPDAAALELSARHVLNNFDIPFGLIRADDNPQGHDHTLCSTICL